MCVFSINSALARGGQKKTRAAVERRKKKLKKIERSSLFTITLRDIVTMRAHAHSKKKRAVHDGVGQSSARALDTASQPNHFHSAGGARSCPRTKKNSVKTAQLLYPTNRLFFCIFFQNSNQNAIASPICLSAVAPKYGSARSQTDHAKKSSSIRTHYFSRCLGVESLLFLVG